MTSSIDTTPAPLTTTRRMFPESEQLYKLSTDHAGTSTCRKRACSAPPAREPASSKPASKRQFARTTTALYPSAERVLPDRLEKRHIPPPKDHIAGSTAPAVVRSCSTPSQRRHCTTTPTRSSSTSRASGRRNIKVPDHIVGACEYPAEERPHGRRHSTIGRDTHMALILHNSMNLKEDNYSARRVPMSGRVSIQQPQDHLFGGLLRDDMPRNAEVMSSRRRIYMRPTDNFFGCCFRGGG